MAAEFLFQGYELTSLYHCPNSPVLPVEEEPYCSLVDLLYNLSAISMDPISYASYIKRALLVCVYFL